MSGIAPILAALLLGSLISESGFAENYLLLTKRDGKGCEVILWSSATRVSRALNRLDTCPERLFVSSDNESALYVDGQAIHQISFDENRVPTRIAELPDLTFEKIAAAHFSRPLTDYEEMTAANVMEVRRLGKFSDQTIWMQAGLVMAGDDDYDFLFELVDLKWVIREFMYRGRFVEKEFAALAGDESNGTGKSVAPQLWSNAITKNPHHIRDESTPIDDSVYRDIAKTNRYFRFENRELLLEVWSGAGPDTGLPYLAGAVVRYSDDEALVICQAQCSATLVGRYLLAQRFWGGSLELYDIATGESIFGEIAFATWILRTPAQVLD